MPKTEPIKRDPWAGWKGMVLQAKEHLGLTDEDIANRLVPAGKEKRIATGSASPRNDRRGPRKPSRQTVTRWRKNPDSMPLWAFARINRILEIEAKAAREAVVVWR